MVDKIENIEIDMDVSEEETQLDEVGIDDFQGSNFLKNPEVGESIEFTVEKVVRNKIVTAKTQDGQEFNVGVEDKNGNVKRYDIYTDQGIYTVNTWQIYFKLFDNKKESQGVLIKYALKHNKSFTGAKIKITRNYDGSHMRMKIPDLMKIKGFTNEEETKKYQDEVKQAKKDGKLYSVELLNGD